MHPALLGPALLDPALLYAQLHCGNPGDVAHYVEVCEGATSALELGSGAGRITLPLAARGLDVTGLELSETLAALAQRKIQGEPAELQRRVTWCAGDMRRMDLGRTFDRILLPYNGLYCLGGLRGALACFERAAAHLKPGGELWLDVYVADAFHDEAPLDDELDQLLDGPPPAPSSDASAAGTPPAPGPVSSDSEPVAEVEVIGQRLRVFEDTRWDRDEQRLEVSYRFLDDEGREAARQELVHNYLLVPEIVLLLDEVGLEVIRCSGGFAREPYDDDAELFVLGARRPSL